MIPKFSESHLESIARVLIDVITHRELTTLLHECAIQERDGTPRWERLLLALAGRQEDDRCGNNVGAFIEKALHPSRFAGRLDAHHAALLKVNRLLAFDGLQLTEAGKLVAVARASTVSEAEARASRLRQELVTRKVHEDVLAFCRAELLQDNYFHAVLEATKSVAEKVRRLTGLPSDGAPLFDASFGGDHPLLALNALQTDTMWSEQRGFVNLLKGMFGVFRQPGAHATRLKWPIDEQDALDLLTLASYVHRRIDAAVRSRWASGGVA